MNVIVIISDTLRRDHLGCYGNRAIATPNLDRFAEECLVFDHCYAASFPTVPMRVDLFTGKYDFTYLGWQPLPRDEVVLAQQFRNAGYATIGAADTPFLVRDGYGFDRGFKDFTWIHGQGNAVADRDRGRVNAERRHEEDYCAPRTMIKAQHLLEYYYRSPFFLYVDTWDPHEPWDPPPWYVERYLPGYDGRVVDPVYWDWREKGLTEDDLRVAHACYCGEISMVDRWVGQLLEKVKVLGLWDETIILFASDHGFFFGEHGQFGKTIKELRGFQYQSPLYQELIRTPLLIRVPGSEPRRIDAMVSAVDFMPTLLELAGVEMPRTMHGRSLVPVIRGEQDELRDFVVSSYPLYEPGDSSRIVDDQERTVREPHLSTVTTRQWTFLYATEDFPAQLYDMRRDPREQHNVVREHRDVAQDLHAKFVRLLEEVNTPESHLASRRTLNADWQ